MNRTNRQRAYNEAEENPRARITKKMAARIRSSHARGELEIVLADRFGITQAEVSQIVKGKRW